MNLEKITLLLAYLLLVLTVVVTDYRLSQAIEGVSRDTCVAAIGGLLNLDQEEINLIIDNGTENLQSLEILFRTIEDDCYDRLDLTP